MEEWRGNISQSLNQIFRYPRGALVGDYLRSAAGIACTLGPLVFLQPAGALVWALAAGAAIFLLYLARTVCSSAFSLQLDEAGIRASGPLGAVIRWGELRLIRLEYYSTRSDRSDGWLNLVIEGARGRIGVDSRLEGFAALVRAVTAEGARRGIELDEATRANLAALDA
jgi:hypothetical protein